jgi:hypothetical protein
MVQFDLNLEPLHTALDLDEALTMLGARTRGDAEDGR